MTEGQYSLRWTAEALKMLKNLSDRRIQAGLVERAEGLVREPEKQGKPLTGELFGFRSVRAIGQRYRIIYRREQKKVFIAAVGIRKEGSRSDVYALARRLLRLRLLEPSE